MLPARCGRIRITVLIRRTPIAANRSRRRRAVAVLATSSILLPQPTWRPISSYSTRLRVHYASLNRVDEVGVRVRSSLSLAMSALISGLVEHDSILQHSLSSHCLRTIRQQNLKSLRQVGASAAEPLATYGATPLIALEQARTSPCENKPNR